MADAGSRKPGSSDVARRSRRSIPTDPSGPFYGDQFDRYLDQLLDDALDKTFPASDAFSLPTRRDTETQ
jgi:hypothetical protein